MNEVVTDFTALHDAMSEELRTRIKALRTVDALEDEPPSDAVLTPAVFVGVEEVTGTRKLTGGRLALTCSMVAYCLISKKTKRSGLQIINMAASVASVVDGNRWGMVGCVEPPKRLSALPGSFSKGGNGLECWAVSWEQVIHVGDEWKAPEIDADGFWLAGCHDELHKLEDFPNVDE